MLMNILKDKKSRTLLEIIVLFILVINLYSFFSFYVLANPGAPFIQNITITPSIAYTNSTLNCSSNYGDADSDKGNVTFSWYNGTTKFVDTIIKNVVVGTLISGLIEKDTELETWNDELCSAGSCPLAYDEDWITNAWSGGACQITQLYENYTVITGLDINLTSKVGAPGAPTNAKYNLSFYNETSADWVVLFNEINNEIVDIYSKKIPDADIGSTLQIRIIGQGLSSCGKGGYGFSYYESKIVYITPQKNNEVWNCTMNATDSNNEISPPNSTTRTITETAPTIQTKTLIPSSPNTTDNLICTFNITGTGSLSVNASFFNGSRLTYSFNQSVTSGVNSSVTLRNENTTKSENWLCQINAYNGSSRNIENTTSVTIQNTAPPSVTLYNNDTNTSDTTPTFNWSNSSDADEDILTYILKIYNDSRMLDNNQTLQKITSQNYTLASGESLDDRKYYWYVIVTDNSSNSSQSSNFTVTIDTTSPLLTLTHPKTQQYATNLTLPLNYTVTDALVGIGSCWYSVNSSVTEISDTLITNCFNTTFNVSGTGTYSLNLSVNDTVGNTNSSVVTFGITLTSPSVVLDYPINNQYLNYTQNISFNFTATDSEGLDSCQLWSNWTGAWHKNYTWNKPTNATQNYTKVNMTDGQYIWNIWCNDTLNNGGWALSNLTVIVDTTYPLPIINSITTTVGSQTITFSHNVTEANIDNCKYSIFNATSGSVDGLNANVSLTNCNSTISSATVTSYGTFNLSITAIDKVGWENVTSKQFTVSASTSSSSGDGGGAPPTERSVVAIKKPANITKTFSNLQRAILYLKIRGYCTNFSISKTTCSLLAEKKFALISLLNTLNMQITENELNQFLDYYNKNLIENVQVSKSDADTYNLVVAIVSITEAEWQLFPTNIDTPCLMIEDTCSYIVQSSRTLKSCEIIDGDIGFTCTLTSNSTTLIVYKSPVYPLDFSTKILSSKVLYTDTKGGSKFQTITFRALVPTTLNIIIFVSFLGGITLLIIKRKPILKKIKSLIKRKN